MKNSLETKLGIFVVLAVFAAWAIIETLGGADFFSHGYHVNAQFESAQDLKIGDRVKMAGVVIGRVEDISLADSKVNVRMKIKESAAVKTDSKAVIRFTGLMGQNFVSLAFGSAAAPKATEGTILEAGLERDHGEARQRRRRHPEHHQGFFRRQD
jgi:phospholipid/cholesterol/gamma-HCH transport system substrate-binding protein